MRVMRIAVFASLLLAACYRTEYSHEMREPGRVEQITFVPGGSGSGTGVGYDLTGKGGMTVTSTTVTIPDRYAIVFSCMHGKFTLKPEGETAKRMFARLKQGDSVTLVYREEYHVTDTTRELARLDFLDALPRRSQ